MNIDLRNLKFISSILRIIASDTENHFGIKFTITSLYRIDDPGVHGTLPLRGIDFRCKDDNLGKVVEDYVNDKWIYDYRRPKKVCCVYHDSGSGKHLHFQTHPNTRLRND